MSQWIKYPESKPTESGYYYTYYHNITEDKHYYKSIWYSVEHSKWAPWRNNLELNVLGYVKETRNDYYVPCEMYSSEHVKESFNEHS